MTIRKSLILIAACGVAALSAVALPHRVMADDIPVQLTVGETATLNLDGNPSTGYSWVLRAPPPSGYYEFLNVDIVGYVKPQLKPGERALLGAPQKFQVLLTAVDAGRVYLVFDYVKAGDALAAKTQGYKIEVLDDANVTDELPGNSTGEMRRDLFRDSDGDRDPDATD